MNALVRSNLSPLFDSLRDFENVENRLSKFLGWPLRHRDGGKEDLALMEWSPAVDIIEDENEFVIKAELPQIKREDVKVSVENGELNISGERKFEKEEKDKKYHRVERAYGCFHRSFSLPPEVNSERVKADFKDGLLCVHLPKDKSRAPGAVQIEVT
jgi:HSP20 family protein